MSSKLSAPPNAPTAPKTFGKKMKTVGPGFVTAATGVGTGDLIAALVAGAAFGTTLVWAIIVGAVLKFFLTEGIGRFHLATGKTILEGWHSLGKWAMGYFGVYSVLWGFSYGAAAMSASALLMAAMVPALPVWVWAIIHGLAGFLLVMTGRYKLFENIMIVLIGVMFVTVVGSAVMLLPDLGNVVAGLVPTFGDSNLLLVLGLLGGVGGTITMASYGYWIQEKQWHGKSWLSMMRFDSVIAYVITAIFTVSLLIVGAEFLFGTGVTIEGEEGLITLSLMFSEEFGPAAKWLFLIGAWSAAFSSLLGVWNGVPYLFADFWRLFRKRPLPAGGKISEKDPAYRAYLIWLTFPPMILLFFGKPVLLVILYGALGAIFMPFLAFTLLWLLNTNRVTNDFRSGWVSNTVLVACILVFVVLGVQQLINVFS
ncbi:Nramp family divalent metal transporter [Aureibacillus halotolerans]|uniref:Mn2+/Fe2+ NRAMP family transporter n=1 Tax=Aureibacillus halotolerans TaxID=1508390 RepID=A0A4R6TV67_9BACI|nr:Nramp family divalent metal transporter [Aureibacillus halotolerans]TDQ36133.1 Mn2+/Fe2+ NRAMP family transporter [Aureibacillus halotolerans]